MNTSWVSVFEFTRSHPDCTHCGTVARALVIWPAEVHKQCPCICHAAHKHDTQVKKGRKSAAMARQR